MPNQPPSAESHAPVQSWFGKVISAVIVLLALLLVFIAVRTTTQNPRTDDAEVFANFIGIAPVVEGPITELPVKDNQLVHAGDLLFHIDDAPYLYALQNAQSQQQALAGQIDNESRHIAAQQHAASAAAAGIDTAQANNQRNAADVLQAAAQVDEAKAELQRATEEAAYARANAERIAPLLAKRYVTPDQLQQAQTLSASRAQSVGTAQAALAAAQARLEAARAAQRASAANVTQSGAQYRQSRSAVDILSPLTAQRGARAAAVSRAQYDYAHTRVYAPFDARVTNLRISEGAYAKAGQQVFTLIDTRVWWVIANFRETQLQRIHVGDSVEVYTMSHPNERLHGTVDSIGYAVTPDADTIGRFSPDLPDTQRTLNWVHLASRYPVRIRIDQSSADRLRIGESSTVIIHPAH
jgi:membrane fusion protein, multidrug efflux system